MAVRPRPGSVLVPVRPIPRFRILSEMDRTINNAASALLAETMREVRDVIRLAPSDPEEEALVLAAVMARSAGKSDDRIHALADMPLTTPLEKSAGVFDPDQRDLTLDEARGLAQVAHFLRKEHGAPITPAGLVDSDEARAAILGMVPFMSGRLVPNRVGARRVPPRARPRGEDQAVALVDEFHLDENIRSRDMRAVLAGSLVQPVVAVQHPPSEGRDPVYTIREGGATFLLAQWLGLPALEMTVLTPRETISAPGALVPTTDFDDLNRLMRDRMVPFAYVVPPALEPLAEIARDLDRRPFMDSFEGHASKEEIEARQEADMVWAARERVWISMFRATRMSGLDSEASKRRADNAPEFKRLTSTWRTHERKAVEMEIAGHEARERMRRAKALAGDIAKELGIPLSGFQVSSAGQLWFAARHGAGLTEDELVDISMAEDVEEPTDRLPPHISTPRHPNLFEWDAHPGVFRPSPTDREQVKAHLRDMEDLRQRIFDIMARRRQHDQANALSPDRVFVRDEPPGQGDGDGVAAAVAMEPSPVLVVSG